VLVLFVYKRFYSRDFHVRSHGSAACPINSREEQSRVRVTGELEGSLVVLPLAGPNSPNRVRPLFLQSWAD